MSWWEYFHIFSSQVFSYFSYIILIRKSTRYINFNPKSRCESDIYICVNSESRNLFWLQKADKRCGKCCFSTSSFSDECDLHNNNLIIFWEIIYKSSPFFRSYNHLFWSQQAIIETRTNFSFIIIYCNNYKFLTPITIEVIRKLRDLFQYFWKFFKLCTWKTRSPASGWIHFYTPTCLSPTHSNIMTRCEPKYSLRPDHSWPFFISIGKKTFRMKWSKWTINKWFNTVFLRLRLMSMMTARL